MNVTRSGMTCDVLILGAGPGGYAAAIRAGQLGLKTIVVEGAKPGGTCLNVGCIPSKAMIHVADEFHKACEFSSPKGSPLGIKHAKPKLDLSQSVAWKDGIVAQLNAGVAGLVKKNGATLVKGWGRMLDGKTCEVETEEGAKLIHAEHVILAPGSVATSLPGLPFGDKILSSTEALELTEVPKKLVVVGGGYIGLELGTAFAKMGSKVTIVEFATQILPHYDKDIAKPVAKSLADLGVTVMLGAKAKSLSDNGSALLVEDESGKEISLPADKVLVTVGRKPRMDGWGADNLYLTMDGPFIKIDSKCRTSMSDVYAIGDVTGEPTLAHRAIAQGEAVAEIIAGKARQFDPVCIPAVCFTDPEVVVTGLLPQQAKDQGYDVEIGLFPFLANGRAMTMESDSGFVRVVARKDNHVVLGVQAVGKGVAELSSSFALALEMGARLEDIAGTIHAHPTQSEAFQEAALKALGHALHI
ncbi:MAG: dihydrolipoyl dehydrogenase [Cohaesibacter sp.]|jgi:dihydrolipoamide dehydrogenase|nr:dihydrolipoyl dehydrogenase [Cohaesibacter sp.]